MHSLILGILLAALVLLYYRKQGDRPILFALTLASFPLFYIAFAIYNQPTAVPNEILWGLPFLLAPLLLTIRNHRLLFVLTAIMFIIHGGYDWLHHYQYNGEYVPSWYAYFCATFDMCVAIYLLAFVCFQSKTTDQ